MPGRTRPTGSVRLALHHRARAPLTTRSRPSLEGTPMSEEAERARQALQESMDLREQGHTDD
jgi:hypothetical protein